MADAVDRKWLVASDVFSVKVKESIELNVGVNFGLTWNRQTLHNDATYYYPHISMVSMASLYSFCSWNNSATSTYWCLFFSETIIEIKQQKHKSQVPHLLKFKIVWLLGFCSRLQPEREIKTRQVRRGRSTYVYRLRATLTACFLFPWKLKAQLDITDRYFLARRK